MELFRNLSSQHAIMRRTRFSYLAFWRKRINGKCTPEHMAKVCVVIRAKADGEDRDFFFISDDIEEDKVRAHPS